MPRRHSSSPKMALDDKSKLPHLPIELVLLIFEKCLPSTILSMDLQETQVPYGGRRERTAGGLISGGRFRRSLRIQRFAETDSRSADISALMHSFRLMTTCRAIRDLLKRRIWNHIQLTTPTEIQRRTFHGFFAGQSCPLKAIAISHREFTSHEFAAVAHTFANLKYLTFNPLSPIGEYHQLFNWSPPLAHLYYWNQLTKIHNEVSRCSSTKTALRLAYVYRHAHQDTLSLLFTTNHLTAYSQVSRCTCDYGRMSDYQ